MKKLLFVIISLFMVLPLVAVNGDIELGQDFEFLNSIYVSLSAMSLVTYALTEFLKLKLQITNSLSAIGVAAGVGVVISMIGWVLNLGFLANIEWYSSLVYGLISAAVAAFGYDIIKSIKIAIVSKDQQLNS